MFTNSPSSLTFCLLQRTTCPDWTIYSWKGFYSIGCPLMLRTNYRCVQSLNISVVVAKCVENVHKFTQFTYFLSVTKNDLSLMNNLVMARFELNRMSFYANNIQLMFSVIQHQCWRRQMCGKRSQIDPVHSLFVCYKILLVLTEQSIHGKVPTHKFVLWCLEQTTDVFSHSTSV